ncbi:hybrid sensor histidine kinase/response regulator [Chondromyces apiculatus]|uniref:histidine kinase n=1 Tax=Chondromyces apiculatus DSM 436 TaxID=1192034 RepID=A0A017THN2_9BACT|nr:ATP-binding protein [Chondromyces apiculatus]EYF08412.1 Two-component sensor histidine kinase [Chondromyces apiculatus DSM 436]
MPARILIIDDNTSLASNLRDILQGARELDVEVTLARDGKTGLAIAARDGFEVAMVDIKLPDANGVDLIRPLRATSPQGEVVLVTGFATVDMAIGALREGAFAFVLKSFRAEELISTLAQAMEKISLKREREELERRHRALVEAAGVLIVGLSLEGQITLVNPKLTALSGGCAGVSVGASFQEALEDETDRRRFHQAFQEALALEGAPEVEVGLRDASKAIRRVRWHLSGVPGATAKKAEMVYGIGIDVTERRALERKAADMEALNAMAPLALGLAHEIRNPLNAAVLELHLLSRAIDRLPDEGVRAPMKRRVGIVESEIARLGRLLGEFLELARPRAPLREPVDLTRVVSEVLELEAEACARGRVEVVRDFDGDCWTLGDVEKLKQVVLNLVMNALDAMPEGGTIRAVTRGEAQEVWLSIGDTGTGISATILAEIFDPFFTTKPGGTGLGLAIVRKIVDQHGGRVVVVGQEEGTGVQVVLPRYVVPVVTRGSRPPRGGTEGG